jgi:FkbM family methyltransferase
MKVISSLERASGSHEVGALIDVDIVQRLEAVLSTSIDEMKLYEQEVLGRKLNADWKSSVVLFGASALGHRTLDGLRRLGIEPVAFADNKIGKWGTKLGGLDVMSPDEVVRKFGRGMNFIVCVWRSDGVMTQLRKLGCQFALEFKGLFWHYPSEFLPNMRVDRPHLILQEAQAVRDAFALLSDRSSRLEYVRQIEWLLKYDFDFLETTKHREQYFEYQLFSPHAAEVFVDCGAYTGDTLQAFLRHCARPLALHALEPEPSNLAALKAWRGQQRDELRDRIFVHAFAASDRRRMLRFKVDGVGSAIDDRGDVEVEAVSLNELLADEMVTFIKMDIEGGEPAAIDGATRLISLCRPVLAICLYHRQEHLFTIPNKVSRIVDGYSFFIRRYGDQFGDVVCYGVPLERISASLENSQK